MRNIQNPEILKALALFLITIFTAFIKTTPCKATVADLINTKEGLKPKHTLSELSVFAPVEAYIKLSQEPRLKETVTATITVTFLDDISYIFRNKDEMIKDKTYDKFVKMFSKNLRWEKDIPRHMKLVLIPSKGVEILNGNKEIYWDMKKGETKSFQIDLRLNSSPISLSGAIFWFLANEKKGARLSSSVKGIGFVLLNKKTGRLGTRKELEELLNKLPEYGYDIILGMRAKKWELYPQEEVEMIRETLPDNARKPLVKIQKQMREIQMLDSSLTDLEILGMLHDITYQMVVRYGIHKKEESLPILLRGRILVKEQNLSKWDAIDEIVEEMNQKRQRMKLIWSTAVFSSLILFLIFLIALERMKRRKIR
ncbi:MAG: hypothetical protein E3J87_05970 [Candidatus Cloacimonadota bacterium]|nr:MAG: hypothetical protein E3J87_05970 [Candidatus Cloacimonadota bacterium]